MQVHILKSITLALNRTRKALEGGFSICDCHKIASWNRPMVVKLVFASALISAVLFSTQRPVQAAALPTEEEVRGIQSLCGAGNITSISVKGDVDTAISNWRKVSAGVEAEIAKKNLTGALGQIKNDAEMAPVYKIYVDCVSDSIRQILDRQSGIVSSTLIGTNLYLQERAMIEDPSIRMGQGPMPAPEFLEINRGRAELIPQEKYWIPPANQSIPAEISCNSGPSAGYACLLDSNRRLSAYTRPDCRMLPAEG